MNITFAIFFILLLNYTLSQLTYDPSLAFSLCNLAVASYCKPDKIKQWNCKSCTKSPLQLKEITLFHNSTGHLLGYIGISSQLSATVLVFRGTLPWQIQNDFIDNDFVKINFPLCLNSCKVHSGFYHGYKDISQQVSNGIKNYITKFSMRQVIIVGHSLGGALATHAALHLRSLDIKVKYLFTFGSFRVGDLKFSQWYKNYMAQTQTFRITHARDPIPHVPERQQGFNHIGHEIFYPGTLKQGYVSCNDESVIEDSHCSDRHRYNINVQDHMHYFGIEFTKEIAECLI